MNLSFPAPSLNLAQIVSEADVLYRECLPKPTAFLPIAVDPFEERLLREQKEIKKEKEERKQKMKEEREEKMRHALEQQLERCAKHDLLQRCKLTRNPHISMN